MIIHTNITFISLIFLSLRTSALIAIIRSIKSIKVLLNKSPITNEKNDYKNFKEFLDGYFEEKTFENSPNQNNLKSQMGNGQKETKHKSFKVTNSFYEKFNLYKIKKWGPTINTYTFTNGGTVWQFY